MADSISVPVKTLSSKRWGLLSYFGNTHLVCAENVDTIDSKFSFAGGHRVRLVRLKKNVHWQLPAGVELDIAEVPTAAAPRRQPPQR